MEATGEIHQLDETVGEDGKARQTHHRPHATSATPSRPDALATCRTRQRRAWAWGWAKTQHPRPQ
jgi:hypothetical protein